MKNKAIQAHLKDKAHKVAELTARQWRNTAKWVRHVWGQLQVITLEYF